MIYVIAYFLAGTFMCAGVAIMNQKVGNWRGWGSIGYALVLLPLWPLWGFGFLKWAMRPTKSRCAWCGAISNSDAEVKAHIMACKLHPMHQEIEAARADAEQLARALSDGYYGSLRVPEQTRDRRMEALVKHDNFVRSMPK